MAQTKTNSTPIKEYNYIGKITEEKDKTHFISTKLVIEKRPRKINKQETGLSFYNASIVLHPNITIPVEGFNQSMYNRICIARGLKTRLSGAEFFTLDTISQIMEGSFQKAGEEARLYHRVETIVVGGDTPFILSEFIKEGDYNYILSLKATGVAFKDLVVPFRAETVNLKDGQSISDIFNITKKTEENELTD